MLPGDGPAPHVVADLDDDVLSGWGRDQHRLTAREEPRARRASEVVFVWVALVYPAWHWIFLAVMPSLRDPLGERLAVSAVMIAAMIGCRLALFRRYLSTVEQGLLFFMTAHYLSMLWRNDLAVPYMIGLFVMFASISAVISRLAVALSYVIGSVVVVTIMIALSPNRTALDVEYLVGLATVLSAVGVGAYKTSLALKTARTRIWQSRQILRQIIETIPDPIFVRASNGSLVLANQAGHKFESAFGYDPALVAEQEQRTLSGGHTLEADAQRTIVVGSLAMSVKTAVASMVDGPTILVTIMRDVTSRRALEESLQRRLTELEATQERVRQLQGILPVCMHCGRIRAADGEWSKLESYVVQHSQASFTHTLCNGCLEQHYPADGSP